MTVPAIVRYRGLFLALLALGMIVYGLWAVTFVVWGRWFLAAVFLFLFACALAGYKAVAGYKA